MNETVYQDLIAKIDELRQSIIDAYIKGCNQDEDPLKNPIDVPKQLSEQSGDDLVGGRPNDRH
jgi:hypothetical protein